MKESAPEWSCMEPRVRSRDSLLQNCEDRATAVRPVSIPVRYRCVYKNFPAWVSDTCMAVLVRRASNRYVCLLMVSFKKKSFRVCITASTGRIEGEGQRNPYLTCWRLASLHYQVSRRTSSFHQKQVALLAATSHQLTATG